ncbi:hypothetical protein PDJAM_G00259870 [Pangasius djambal]|nr:hypothetical protein [Pangasius djambal]
MLALMLTPRLRQAAAEHTGLEQKQNKVEKFCNGEEKFVREESERPDCSTDAKGGQYTRMEKGEISSYEVSVTDDMYSITQINRDCMNVMEEIKSAPPQSPPTTPTSKATASPNQAMGLGSPELLKELKQPHTLKPVHTHTGLTTVFCGRGRTNAAPASQSQTPPPSDSTNQHTAKGHRLSSGTQN